MSQTAESISQYTRYSFSLVLNALIKKAKPRKKKMNIETDLSVNIALFKGDSIIDFVQNSIHLRFLDQHAKIETCILNFDYTENDEAEDEESQYTLRIYHSQNTCISKQSAALNELLLGELKFSSNIYTEVFNDDRKSIFTEKAEVSNDFILDYRIYVENSRELVQKLLIQQSGCNEECRIFRNAFKKQIGRRKVKLIQINNNTECELNDSQQGIVSPRNIYALKKIGNAYYPILQRNNGIKLEQFSQNREKLVSHTHSPNCKSVSSRQSKKSRKTATNAKTNSTHYSLQTRMTHNVFEEIQARSEQKQRISPEKGSPMKGNAFFQSKYLQNKGKSRRLYKTMSAFIILGFFALIFSYSIMPSTKI